MSWTLLILQLQKCAWFCDPGWIRFRFLFPLRLFYVIVFQQWYQSSFIMILYCFDSIKIVKNRFFFWFIESVRRPRRGTWNIASRVFLKLRSLGFCRVAFPSVPRRVVLVMIGFFWLPRRVFLWSVSRRSWRYFFWKRFLDMLNTEF